LIASQHHDEVFPFWKCNICLSLPIAIGNARENQEANVCLMVDLKFWCIEIWQVIYTHCWS
jgi:hypothetical protein